MRYHEIITEDLDQMRAEVARLKAAKDTSYEADHAYQVAYERYHDAKFAAASNATASTIAQQIEAFIAAPVDRDWDTGITMEKLAHHLYDLHQTRPNLNRLFKVREIKAGWNEAAAAERKASQPAPEPAVADDEHAWRGQHHAPDHEGDSPLFDLTLNGTFPDDFYEGHHNYYCGDPNDQGALNFVFAAHKRPNMQVKIYRSIPKNIAAKITPGDWVALTRRYVVEHGRASLNNDFKILTKTVFARDLFNEGNLSEWGYDPQPAMSRDEMVRRGYRKARLVSVEPS